MMSRRLFLALLCLIGCVRLIADPVSASQAREKASQFLNKRVAMHARRSAPAASALKMMAAGRDDSYYIFNVGDDAGFVVVSGEDATEEILGYSDTGSINTDSMPCGMRALFDSYARQISYLRTDGDLTPNGMSTPLKTFSLNKTLARYGQGKPYNSLCPRGGIISGWECCPTGCMATAMAQLFYYHQWPKLITNEIPAYTTLTKEYEIEAIPANTPINWKNIKSSYSEDEEGDEIARLMMACGASVHMDYDPGIILIRSSSSEAYGPTVTYALQQYFAYKTDATYERSIYYSYDNWIKMLQNELDVNGPIIYRGSNDEGGGHFFLIEGYDENGYFDINWGWDGAENGKYTLVLINNDTSRRLPYYIGQDALINVSPKASAQSTDIPLRLWSSNVTASGTCVYSKSLETGSFDDVKVSLEMYNFIPKDALFDYAIAYQKYGSEDEEKTFSLMTDVNLPVTAPVKETRSFSMEPISDGKYSIWVQSKKSGTTIWIDNDNSLHEYIDAWVCGDKLSLKYTGLVSAQLNCSEFKQTNEAAVRVGQTSEFGFILTNITSPANYNGGILVKEAESDHVIHIDEVEISGLSSKGISFSYTPASPGEHKLMILNKRWDEIGQFTVKAYSASASLDMLEVTDLTLKDGDLDRGLIDGTTLSGTFCMKNNDVIEKKANVIIGLEDVEAQTKRTKRVAVNIAPSNSVRYSFSFGNLTADHHYVITASYASGEEFYCSPELLCTTNGLGEVEPGNEDIIAYEYWFDDEFADRKTVNMSGNNAVVRASIDASDLSNGVHRFSFRVKRADGKYSAITSNLFMHLKGVSSEQLEYWLDDDYENRQSVSISHTEEEQELTLDMSNPEWCSTGFHRLNIQAIDSKYGRTAVSTTGILKIPQGTATQVEYWFDNNVSNSHILNGRLSADEGGYIINADIDVSQLSVGVHRLNCRACDKEKNFYGSVISSPILKVPSGKASILEYWLDGNRENIHTIEGAPTDDGKDYKFISDLDLGAVTPGHHRLSFRAKSSAGNRVTAVNTVPIIVKSNYNVEAKDVKMTKYSIAVDDEEPVELSLPNPGNVVDIAHSLDSRYLTKGNHQLKLRLANSMNAAVNVQQAFAIEEITAPSINLTAEVSNGLVNIHFNSVPSDNGYRIYRIDANGNSKLIKNEKKSSYPTDIYYTDNPPSGTYTYYAKSIYTDIDGESQNVKSNEASVSLTDPQKDLGYVEGLIYYNGKRKVGFKSDIRFGDNVVVQSNGEGVFRRDRIPVGTTLSVFLTENDYYTSNTVQVTIKKGVNSVRLDAIPRNDVSVNNQMEYGSLTYFDRLIWEPGVFFKLPLTNTSHETWNGKICIKVIPKRYDVEEEPADASDDTQIGQGSSVLAGNVASLSALPFFRIKNYQSFVSEDFQLVYNQKKEVYVPLTGLHNDGPTEPFNFYVYCVKRDGSMSLLRPDFRFNNTQNNPMEYTLEGGTSEEEMTEEERVAYYTNLIVYYCGLVEDVDNILGKSRDVLGYANDKLKADYYKFTYATEEGIELTLRDEGMQEVVYDMIQKCDKYSNEVKSFRDDIAPIVQEYTNISLLWGYVKNSIDAIKKYSEELSSKNDCERVGYISKKIIDLSATSNPFTPILKKYIDIGEKAIEKILKLSWAYNQTYLPQDMCEKKFKVRVKVIQKNGTAINFPFWGSGMIDKVLVKGWNKNANNKPAVAEARFKNVKGNILDVTDFTAVFEQDGIDNASNLFSDGETPFTQLWAEIYWHNGRVSYVPLTEGLKGVEYSRGEHSNSIFTITFDSETNGYGSVADVIHLRE